MPGTTVVRGGLAQPGTVEGPPSQRGMDEPAVFGSTRSFSTGCRRHLSDCWRKQLRTSRGSVRCEMATTNCCDLPIELCPAALTLEVRLASQLVYLFNRQGGRKTQHGFQLAGRYRQGDLADLLGTTTRSIITILNSWRKDGIVIYDSARGHLTICREDDLQQCILACRNRTTLCVASDLAKAGDGD